MQILPFAIHPSRDPTFGAASPPATPPSTLANYLTLPHESIAFISFIPSSRIKLCPCKNHLISPLFLPVPFSTTTSSTTLANYLALPHESTSSVFLIPTPTI